MMVTINSPGLKITQGPTTNAILFTDRRMVSIFFVGKKVTFYISVRIKTDSSGASGTVTNILSIKIQIYIL